MYIWTVEFEERWSSDSDYDNNGAVFKVSAKTADRAIEKAKKLMSIGKVYKDDDGDEYWLEDVRVIRLERGDEIDA